LLYDAEQRATEFLTLPHPRLHLRRFVLTPLAELAPQLIHPTLDKSMTELLAQTDDNSEVKRWNPKIRGGEKGQRGRGEKE
jgi:2-amino-4-hydroxy-6-hydroxymethyldihydropteridine diphosphokinase